MFTAGINGAISGFVIGGIIGGLVSAKQGNSFLDGLLEGSVYGLINGFTTSAILFCGSETLKAIRKPSCCFIAGTVVLTEEGNKAIEDIEVGDMVWAYNEETGQKDLKRVVRLFRNETEEWIHIDVYKTDKDTCEEIVCTPEHPFYIPNIGWVNASNLVENMEVLLYNGNKVNIAKTKREVFEKPVTTYNFEVEDYHTYYVSESGILVHNSCANDAILKDIAQNPEKIQNYSIDEFKAIANDSSWKTGPLKTPAPNGPGFRAYSRYGSIQWNPGGQFFDAAHNFGGAYWKVSNTQIFRFPYLGG